MEKKSHIERQYEADLKKHLSQDAMREMKKKTKLKQVTKSWSKGKEKWQYDPDTSADDDAPLFEKFSEVKHRTDTKQNLRHAKPADDDALDGRVLEVSGMHFTVQLPDGTMCQGKTYKSTLSHNPDSSLVVVGDIVRIKLIAAAERKEGLITEVVKRRTKLSRQKAFTTYSSTIEDVIVSNIDQLVIVASIENPALKTGLIDRYLAYAEKENLAAILCINKTDLVPMPEIIERTKLYTDLGYDLCFVSAVSKDGLKNLTQKLVGKVSVFSGHSGVGKSSLLNALLGDERLATGEVSRKNLKGSHTTTNAVMLTLDPPEGKAFIVDTPGIKEFGLWGISRAELSAAFKEFKPFADRCEYIACTHTDEVHCAVQQAAESGEINPERYDNYLKIYQTLPE
jgi:ribosome biogenesis GTPase